MSVEPFDAGYPIKPDFSVVCGNCLGRKDEPSPPGWACPNGHPPRPPLTLEQQQAERIAVLERELAGVVWDLRFGTLKKRQKTANYIDALLDPPKEAGR